MPTLLAAGAMLFIAVMAFTGGRRENQQLVKPHAAGLMTVRPQEVDRVEVEREGRRLVFVRNSGGTWNSEGGHTLLPAQTLEHLETSLRFMRVAEPVRVMERHEWEGTADEDFGLAPARYAVRLSGHGRSILAVRFGAANPQRVLQYARVDGRDELYLMPTFVGVEWERVWERSTTAR
jgi:hypothetical protein